MVKLLVNVFKVSGVEISAPTTKVKTLKETSGDKLDAYEKLIIRIFAVFLIFLICYTVVTNKLLRESGVVKNCRDGIKVLGKGELTKKLTVEAMSFSASAKAKIESLGGTCKEFDNKEATA